MRGRKNNPRIELPAPGFKVPAPPREMSLDGKREWGRIARSLYAWGIVTEHDRGVLIAYCQAYGRWAEAERLIRKARAEGSPSQGLMIETTNGNLVQNPIVGVANKALADMVRYAAEMGITPSARARISQGDEAPLRPPPLGKKETAQLLARNAADGTDWGDFLGPMQDDDEPRRTN